MSAIRIIIASALITSAAIKAVPAISQPVAGTDVSVSIVHTADLDLSSAADKRTLDRRLVQAARDACGTASDADLEGKNNVRACRNKVLADARAKGIELASGGADIRIAAR